MPEPKFKPGDRVRFESQYGELTGEVIDWPPPPDALPPGTRATGKLWKKLRRNPMRAGMVPVLVERAVENPTVFLVPERHCAAAGPVDNTTL